MTSVGGAANVGPARKAREFMTNDECIAEAVDSCFGGHDHVCEKYLPRLVAVILRALRKSTRAAGCGEAPRADGTRPSVDDPSSGSWVDFRGVGAFVDP